MLTKRESEILDLLVEGKTVQQIAASLYLSSATVHEHVTHIYRKLGVHTRAQCVREAMLRLLTKQARPSQTVSGWDSKG